MAKRWLTFALVTSPNWRAPTCRSGNSTMGWLVAGQSRAGVSQTVARHHHPALHDDVGGILWDSRSFAAGFRLRREWLWRRDRRLVHQLEGILAVLPRMALSSAGSCRPGTCTRMRSSPALDIGFAGAHFVDAAAHHFDRLFQYLFMRLGLVTIGHGRVSTPPPGWPTSYCLAPDRQHDAGHGGIEFVHQLLGFGHNARGR